MCQKATDCPMEIFLLMISLFHSHSLSVCCKNTRAKINLSLSNLLASAYEHRRFSNTFSPNSSAYVHFVVADAVGFFSHPTAYLPEGKKNSGNRLSATPASRTTAAASSQQQQQCHQATCIIATKPFHLNKKIVTFQSRKRARERERESEQIYSLFFFFVFLLYHFITSSSRFMLLITNGLWHYELTNDRTFNRKGNKTIQSILILLFSVNILTEITAQLFSHILCIFNGVNGVY